MENKYALIIAINYFGQDGELQGCINDGENVEKILRNIYNYKNIEFINDNTAIKPTRANIIEKLKELVEKSHKYNDMWIHFSGHGTNIYDESSDEHDGRDEVICPLDYKVNGYISDDLIYSILKNADPSCKIVSVFDACFSGTVVDLPYKLSDKQVWEKENDNVDDVDILMISGCTDSQYSADAHINNTWQGAMTWALIKSLKKLDYLPSYIELINNMRVLLSDSDYSQIPQLTHSKDVDVNICFLNKFQKRL